MTDPSDRNQKAVHRRQLSSFLRKIFDEMDAYSNKEKAEMHYMCGAADGNVKEAQRLYQEHFPKRRVPDSKAFQRLH